MHNDVNELNTIFFLQVLIYPVYSAKIYYPLSSRLSSSFTIWAYSFVKSDLYIAA